MMAQHFEGVRAALDSCSGSGPELFLDLPHLSEKACPKADGLISTRRLLLLGCNVPGNSAVSMRWHLDMWHCRHARETARLYSVSKWGKE